MWSTAAHCAAVDSPDCLYAWEMKEGKPSNGFPSISILRKEMLRITKKQPSLLSDWLYCSPTEWDSGQWSEPGVGVNPFILALTVARCPAAFGACGYKFGMVFSPVKA